MSAPKYTTVDPLSTLLCGDPIHGNVNREAERESRQHCSERKALKLRSDGTPYTVHASRTVLRGGSQKKVEVMAKEKKILRKYEELPMDLKATASKRRGHEGKPTMELKMPVLDAAARSKPSVSDGKVAPTTPKNVTFSIPDRTKTAAVDNYPTSSGTPIYEAEMAKKARSNTARKSPESNTQRPAVKIFSRKARSVDIRPALMKTPRVTPQTAETTIKGLEERMRKIFDRDPQPLVVPQDLDVMRANFKVVEMPTGTPKRMNNSTSKRDVEAEQEWVDVGKEDDEEWQIV